MRQNLGSGLLLDTMSCNRSSKVEWKGGGMDGVRDRVGDREGEGVRDRVYGIWCMGYGVWDGARDGARGMVEG